MARSDTTIKGQKMPSRSLSAARQRKKLDFYIIPDSLSRSVLHLRRDFHAVCAHFRGQVKAGQDARETQPRRRVCKVQPGAAAAPKTEDVGHGVHEFCALRVDWDLEPFREEQVGILVEPFVVQDGPWCGCE